MKICLIVYKINPVKGSEDASGYHLAKQIARAYPDTTIISRRDHIETIKDDPDFKHVHCIGYDLPAWMSFYKKRSRGIILYYFLWQWMVGRMIRRLDHKNKYNVIHHINFHTDWAPHFIQSPQARIIWGPLAHHAKTPLSWLRDMPARMRITEIFNRVAKAILWSSPLLAQAIQRTHLIFFSHTDWPTAFKLAKGKINLQPYAGSHFELYERPSVETCERPLRFLFVGRFVPLKGPHVALDAFAHLLQHHARPYPHLTLIGDGPMRDRLVQKAQDLNTHYGSVVTILPWQSRDALVDHYRQADMMLYPSLEAQGLVVSEALSQSCPVITLHGTGPAFITQHPDLTVKCNLKEYNLACMHIGHKLIDVTQSCYEKPGYYANQCHIAFERAQDLRWDVIAKNIMMSYG